MSTNSDSLYNILDRIRRDPSLATIQRIGYNNVISIVFSDKISVSEPEFYFPNNSLLVDRFSDDFVNKNSSLLEFFQAKTKVPNRGLRQVWITTSHIVTAKQYMIELTFE
ncbi:hypothetical protein [Pediococcus claussenii]|uniref:Uncharacterized protein n=1 Tax=Pediococcus claussenii (strain ATCC BAA-344 / DSM 14800 / JCM 18046 / KCTC 3811 / LMG 21948 / P06) TaxID=701521 RepID=G8PCF2_PEDCP|nr:hypothetical protein [Pediococcus claussenii]AEV94937.1 hypothetical protein PECL_644 [Pediococcus claussenii ATCC BAA-344]ANZ70129.1 hypothetical protein AYR57_07270 [Pediococcus claussenii]ANZ71944.1 hypothetical protein AYR58_07270 [Pediococcus claussenii]KRN19260.1 hypothetical protein IV79_GL001632 [Pediococcus claussenii]